MDNKSICEEIRQIGRATFLAGLNNSFSGNFSVRRDPPDHRGGNYFLVKRRGAMMGFLKRRDIIRLRLNGSDPKLKFASTEALVHRAILNRTPARAVLHTHPPYATVLSLTEDKLLPLNVETSYYLKEIPVIEFRRPSGSTEMVKGLPGWLKKYQVVIVRGHGTFAVGNTLGEALRYTHSAEDAARTIYLAKLIKLDIKKLSQKPYLSL